MSDKKYPYIGDNGSGQITLVYSDGGCYHIKGEYKGEYIKSYNEVGVKNITREYLSNTYGKCESQDHADFICKLVEANDFCGIKFSFSSYSEKKDYFYFTEDEGFLYLIFSTFSPSNKHTFKNLPLPPKEKTMEEAKPVYTKEMHERGELPPVGSFVEKVTGKGRFDHDVFAETYDDCCIPYGWDVGAKLEVIAHTEISGTTLPVVKHDGLVSAIILSNIKPIPTIEEELIEFVFQNSGIRSRDGGMESARDVAKAILDKYNITKKEDKCN